MFDSARKLENRFSHHHLECLFAFYVFLAQKCNLNLCFFCLFFMSSSVNFSSFFFYLDQKHYNSVIIYIYICGWLKSVLTYLDKNSWNLLPDIFFCTVKKKKMTGWINMRHSFLVELSPFIRAIDAQCKILFLKQNQFNYW